MVSRSNNQVQQLRHLPQVPPPPRQVCALMDLRYKVAHVYLQHLPQPQIVDVLLTLFYKMVIAYLQLHPLQQLERVQQTINCRTASAYLLLPLLQYDSSVVVQGVLISATPHSITISILLTP